MSRAIVSTLAAAALGVLITGCATLAPSGPSAVADLQPTRGNKASGKVTFTQRGNRVLVSANVSGLTPNREHGFHIHEKGDCSSGDGMSTGGHFNPQGMPHGHPATAKRHAGDLPSLKADAYGNASISTEIDIITVNDGPTSVVGKGLIVHAQPDDYRTQPTGNAGARVACAQIRRA